MGKRNSGETAATSPSRKIPKVSTAPVRAASGSRLATDKKHEIKMILGSRVVNGKVEYLLSWNGYESGESSWVSEENLNCPNLLNAFKTYEAKIKEEEAKAENEKNGSSIVSPHPATFDSLPSEIKHVIFKRMINPWSSKINLRLVCSQWKYLADQWLFKHTAVVTDESLPFVRTSTLHFDVLKVENLTQNLTSQKSLTTKSRSDLALNPRKMVFDFSPLSVSCVFPPRTTSVSKENIEFLLMLNSGIRELAFTRCLYADTKLHLHGIYCSNLVYFEITIGRDSAYPSNKTVFHSLSKLKMPSLTAMRITVEEIADDENQIFVGIYQLIASCKRSLKNLDVSFHRFYYFPYEEKPLPLPMPSLNTLRNDLSQIQLEKLVISFDDFDEESHVNLALFLLSCQFMLKKLEVRFHLSRFQNVVQAVQKALEQNSSTVVDLTFRRCVCSIPYEEIPSDSEANLLRSMLQPLPSYSKIECLRFYGLPLTVSSSQVPILQSPSSFPPTIKTLEIAVGADVSVLRGITVSGQTCLPRLEKLLIYSLDQSSENYSLLVHYLKRIWDLSPKLKLLEVYVRTPNFDTLHFASFNSQAQVRKAGLGWDSWHFKRRVNRQIWLSF